MSEQETVLPGAEAATLAPEEGKETDVLAEARAIYNQVKAGKKASEIKAGLKPKKTEEPPKAEAEEKPKAPEAEKAVEEKPKPKTKVTRIRENLLKEGVSQKALDALDDSEVIEFWEREETRNEASRTLHRELEEAKRPKAPAPEPVKDTSEDEALAALTEQFGESEAKAIAKIMSVREKALLNRIESLEGVIKDARETGQRRIIEDNRERLSERLPMLETNDRAWGVIEREVLAAFQKDSKAYDSAEEAFDSIFEDLYGEMAHPEAREEEEPEKATEEKDTSSLKDEIEASAPSLPGKSQAERKLSMKERHRKVFLHAMKHPGDVAGAIKAGRAG